MNNETAKERSRAYYERNRERLIKRAKLRYAQENQHKLWRDLTRLQKKTNSLNKRARMLGVPGRVKIKEMEALFENEVCRYCGATDNIE